SRSLTLTPHVSTHHYTPSLHDALPILPWADLLCFENSESSMRTSTPHKEQSKRMPCNALSMCTDSPSRGAGGKESRSSRVLSLRSEEHTSELQSRVDLVCRLLLVRKNN